MAVTICPNNIESRAPKSPIYLEEVHIVVMFLSFFLEGEKLAEIYWVCQIIHRKQMGHPEQPSTSNFKAPRASEGLQPSPR